VAWSYCQAAGLVAKRKTNQLEQFKREESAGAPRNLNKNNVFLFLFLCAPANSSFLNC